MQCRSTQAQGRVSAHIGNVQHARALVRHSMARHECCGCALTQPRESNPFILGFCNDAG